MPQHSTDDHNSSPNIVFVFADQLRYSALGCSGNPEVRTPNLDQLAQQGVTFDQAFSGCPLCSPYRGQLLTGRYSHKNGVVCNQYQLFRNQQTLAHVLGDAGYRTAYVGKWHLGEGPYTERKRYGFRDMFAYNCLHDYFNVSYYHNEAGPFPMEDYAPGVETQLTLDYIREHQASRPGTPFCVVMSWGPPHWTTPFGDNDYAVYPDEYRTYDPEAVSVPGNVPNELRDFARKEIADYYGMVTSLDDCMGSVMNALDELGLAENTIVCFSSDHGDHLSAHGFAKPILKGHWLPISMQASKGTPYEESVHIPFLLRYPAGAQAGERSDVFLNSVDVMPTLLGLCGVPAPEGVQGRDLSWAASGAPGDAPDSVYLQLPGTGWPSRKSWVGLWRAVRNDRYVYARFKAPDGTWRMLFDHQADPLEMNNLIDDPAYQTTAEEMETRLQEWAEETDDPFDTGKRLPYNNMLDLGQALITPKIYAGIPPELADVLKRNYERLENAPCQT